MIIFIIIINDNNNIVTLDYDYLCIIINKENINYGHSTTLCIALPAIHK